jgi:hypothetical protein
MEIRSDELSKRTHLFFTNVLDFWNKEIINPELYHTATLFLKETKFRLGLRLKPFEVQSMRLK